MKPLLQVCSDLHLEFATNREWFKENPLLPKGEVLIIAGDTFYLDRNYKELDFIKKVSDEFESVYLIPGNHEYYGGFDVSTALEPMCEEIKENVFMVNNYSIEIKGINFIFSTMWSSIQRNFLEIMRWMPDFRKIKYKDEKLNINHFNELHEVAFEFISNAVKSKGKKVVVTHHLPSSACNIEEFKDSILNEVFCVEKTNFILNNEIDYWIYGHSHRNLDDFKIGNTEMITNQFGYINRNEHKTFNYEKTIEIK